MNKAIEGNNTEIEITKQLNKKYIFWEELPFDIENTYAIHVNSKKYGKINDEKIHPKADIYFAKGKVDEHYLIKKNYYLNEHDIHKFVLKPIMYSGLSVKMNKSNFTIIKISPKTFDKIFNSNVLGAGASIYSTKNFSKNIDIINGWGVELNYFKEYFCKYLNIIDFELHDKNTLTDIKTLSNKLIKELILKDSYISDLIFKGIGNFEEPFTAHWLLENNEIKKNYHIPFNVTTGSGRSKNIYTIVLKPKDT